MKFFSSLMLKNFSSHLTWKLSWTPSYKMVSDPLFQWMWTRLNFPLQNCLPWCTTDCETWFTGATLIIEIGVCHWTSFSCIRSFINKQLGIFHLNYSVDDKHTWCMSLQVLPEIKQSIFWNPSSIFWESSIIWAFFRYKTRIVRSIKCQFHLHNRERPSKNMFAAKHFWET